MRSKLFATLTLLICLPLEASAIGSKSGLVARWSLNEGKGLVALDTSGFGHNGSLQKSPVWEAAGGIYGLHFDGIDDYVALSDADDLSFTDGDFTLEVRFRLNQTQTDQDIDNVDCIPLDSCQFFLNKSGEYGLWIHHDGKLKFYTASGSTPAIDLPSSVTDTWQAGQWYYVAAVYEGGTQWKIYVNGVLDNSGFKDYFPNGTEAFLVTLGAFVDPLQVYPAQRFGFLYGDLDEVCISSRAKTAIEIGVAFAKKRCDRL